MSEKFTAKDVAEWMAEKLEQQHYVYQNQVVYEIAQKFGREFMYVNRNGNAAIGAKVLAEFRKLTKDDVVWSKSQRFWRKRQGYDGNSRRQQH